MSRPLSKSKELAGRLLHAALSAVKGAGGSSHIQFVREQVQKTVELDDWALEIIESNGLPRWETYLHFFSIDAVKAGFLSKERGVWRLSALGEEELNKSPVDFLNAANEGYKAWERTQTPKLAMVNSIDEQSDELDAPPEDRMLSIQKEVHE